MLLTLLFPLVLLIFVVDDDEDNVDDDNDDDCYIDLEVIAAIDIILYYDIACVTYVALVIDAAAGVANGVVPAHFAAAED